MAVKFEKVKPGMVLYDRHKYRMGNTTIRSIGEWEVRVLEVDSEKRTALCSWNGNRPETYFARDFAGLSTWSMYDDGVEVRRGICDSVISVKKKRKAKEPK